MTQLEQAAADLEKARKDWEGARLQKCPYRQDLKLFCAEARCDQTDCPIWLKESGLLAEALESK